MPFTTTDKKRKRIQKSLGPEVSLQWRSRGFLAKKMSDLKPSKKAKPQGRRNKNASIAIF